jgi:hypothetical protein
MHTGRPVPPTSSTSGYPGQYEAGADTKPIEGEKMEVDAGSQSRASTFDHKKYVPVPTASVASSQLRVSSVLMRSENIPPAPELASGTQEYECPYCHWLLPARQFTSTRRWKLHIEEDLRPYVCLYEECLESLKLFASVEQWIRHTNKHHSTHWVCVLHQDQKDISN